MKIYEIILTESARADLYHGTSLASAEHILKTGVIRANMPIHATAIPSTVKGADKTISLTRDINVAEKFATDKKYDAGSMAHVVFVFDQDKLMQLGKRVQPYDDTSTKWYSDQLARYDNPIKPKPRSEVEEVIFGDLHHAMRYVKQIVLFMPFDEDYHERILNTAVAKHPLTVVHYQSDDWINTPRQQIDAINKSNKKTNESVNGFKSIPNPPGTDPIPPGTVRLYHQTGGDELRSIERHGLLFAHAKGIEGPKAIYASEKGFYGDPTSRPTLEFFIDKKYWDDPFVLEDVPLENIIAAHYPWHKKARYLEDDRNDILQKALDGEFDDLTGDYAIAVKYIKQKYANENN